MKHLDFSLDCGINFGRRMAAEMLCESGSSAQIDFVRIFKELFNDDEFVSGNIEPHQWAVGFISGFVAVLEKHSEVPLTDWKLDGVTVQLGIKMEASGKEDAVAFPEMLGRIASALEERNTEICVEDCRKAIEKAYT